LNERELSKLLSPAISALGLELIGVELALSRGSGLVRVFVDAPGRAVTIDDCEAASRELSAVLDVNDPISGRYTLEVSSPGVDRPLFTPEQFSRHIGETVKIELGLPIDNRRRFQGAIVKVEGDQITIEQDGAQVAIPHERITRARIKPDYDKLLGTSAKPVPGGKRASRKSAVGKARIK
jgi:ribosome maturation factor RimP